MDEKTYKTRIRNASERVKAGYYTTQEDLEKEIEQYGHFDNAMVNADQPASGRYIFKIL